MNDNFNQMPRPAIHNREDPLSAPKYPQSHVTQYTGELLLTLNLQRVGHFMVFMTDVT